MGNNMGDKISRIMDISMGIYFAVVYPFTLIYIVSATIMTEEEIASNWFLTVAFLVVFISPFFVRTFLSKNMLWNTRILNVMYWSTIAITGFSVISWYYMPDNARLEPATILVGFATAVTGYNRTKIMPSTDES